MKNFSIIRTVAGLLFFMLCGAIHAQNQESIRLNESFSQQPLQDFIDTLETKYHLKVFYRKEWIGSHTIHKDFQETPLIQALNNIFLDSDLTFRFYQDNGVVIFPVESDNRIRIGDASQLLIVGSPLNLGRYKSAILKGKVVDGKTGEPLVGAVIYDAESQKGASTDGNGLFEMELPTGDHRLRFSYMGFQPSNLKIRLIEDGYEEFELFEETHNIAEVTVMGQNADLPRSQMSMVQMSSREIEQLPALMGEVDILKGMTMLAGVQTVGELASGFNVRGGNTDQNLILVNGSPVFNSSHLFGFLSLINPDVVDNVRLFKGGIPVKFGERVASVMEVDFKDGNEETVRVYGGIGIINSRLTLDGPLAKNKKLTFITGGRSSYTNWILQQVPEEELSQSVTHFYDGTGKLTYKFDKHNRLSIMGYISHDEFSTSTQSVNRYGNILTNLEVNTRLGEQLYSDLDISHSRYDYRLTDYANGNPLEAYYLDNFLEYSSASYHLRWHPHPQHSIVAGVKAVRNSISPGELTAAEEFTLIESRKLNEENTIEASVYLGDEYEILPGVSVS
ncbi:MAG TPA: carboxypeptidase-like regulatory domain-containing protein, partial [Tangfeifania sp.]|nr:carboxypeptidase-like regulatory domain-containing protein [Tangfeifania sp.]